MLDRFLISLDLISFLTVSFSSHNYTRVWCKSWCKKKQRFVSASTRVFNGVSVENKTFITISKEKRLYRDHVTNNYKSMYTSPIFIYFHIIIHVRKRIVVLKSVVCVHFSLIKLRKHATIFRSEFSISNQVKMVTSQIRARLQRLANPFFIVLLILMCSTANPNKSIR